MSLNDRLRVVANGLKDNLLTKFMLKDEIIKPKYDG